MPRRNRCNNSTVSSTMDCFTLTVRRDGVGTNSPEVHVTFSPITALFKDKGNCSAHQSSKTVAKVRRRCSVVPADVLIGSSN